MLTQVEIYCPFNRDVSWITQEICEAYAAACLRGNKVAEREALALSGDSYPRMALLKSMLDTHPDFIRLKEELIDNYGIDYFVKSKTQLEHIRDLEERMESETDNEVYAKLSKELRELRGWITKPTEKTQTVNTNILLSASTNVSIDRHNPREVARYYQSIMG